MPPPKQWPEGNNWQLADRFGGPPELVLRSDPYSMPADGQDNGAARRIRIIDDRLREDIDVAWPQIERANPDTLYRVFGAADWSNREILTDEILKDAPEGATLEGFLWPADYRVLPDTTAEELVRLMLDGFIEAVGEERLSVPEDRGGGNMLGALKVDLDPEAKKAELGRT